MANSPPLQQLAELPHLAPQTPLHTGASIKSYFADSAINMDLNTPTVTPQSKPAYESEVDTSNGSPLEKIPDQPDCQADAAGISPLGSDIDTDTDTGPESQTDPEMISHLSMTVSSLRLRHREQLHLQTLFASKLEALAQRSLAQEATIRSMTAELKSLRDSNAQLGRDNALLAHENNHLRVTTQDLNVEITERETSIEAMTGAVRGLEGWIESAANSPQRSNPTGPILSPDQRRPRPSPGSGRGRGRREIIRGKGRFRGRYYIDDNNNDADNGTHQGRNLSDARFRTDTDTFTSTSTDILEGVMAWVRGFKDVEEDLMARLGAQSSSSSSSRRNKNKTQIPAQVNGIPSPRQHSISPLSSSPSPPPPEAENNHYIDDDDPFGDFETA